ncbi:MAG: peptide chain release factor N(5)-glutamine methyltransferase [Alphaproteobacteria bacterium]|nr:peptide chain release factor N(5)-glutamine methyltransferase [Alphaproteobacteria bacterium]
MTDYFSQIVQKLIKGGIENPRLEARILLAHVLHFDPDEIFAGIDVSLENEQKVDALLQQRLAHKPLDKIIGKKAFYKTEFKVNEQVLSPRPDTEILVEEAIECLRNIQSPHILDLGTGSGCIIETLLQELPMAEATAVDISAAALQIARENAVFTGVAERLKFIKADWFDTDFINLFEDRFDVIVSNPPYIPTADIARLDEEVKQYDPLVALDGGISGFDSYRRIAEIAPRLLKDGGSILLEAGINQATEIQKIFTLSGLQHVKTVKDLAGIDRCVIMRK